MDYSSGRSPIFFFFFWPSLPGSRSVLLSHLLRVAVAAAQNATSSESQRRIPSWGSPADVPLPFLKNYKSNLLPRRHICN